MDLQKIREFLTLTELQSFSRTAAQHSISQSALTRHIQDLESEFGTALLIRESGRISLTPSGQLLLQEGRAIIDKMNLLNIKIRQIQIGQQSQLHVGFIAGVMNEDVILTVNKLRFLQPNLKVLLYELSPTEQLKLLKKGEIDVAIVGQPTPRMRQDFDLFEIAKIPLQLALPVESKFAKQSLIDMADVSHMPFIGIDEELFPGRNEYMTRVCNDGGFNPDFIGRGEGVGSMLGMATINQAMVVVPEVTSRIPHSGLVYRAINSPEAFVASAAAVAQGETRQTIRQFLQHLRTVSTDSTKVRQKEYWRQWQSVA